MSKYYKVATPSGKNALGSERFRSKKEARVAIVQMIFGASHRSNGKIDVRAIRNYCRLKVRRVRR